jgi:hypothetical protein
MNDNTTPPMGPPEQYQAYMIVGGVKYGIWCPRYFEYDFENPWWEPWSINEYGTTHSPICRPDKRYGWKLTSIKNYTKRCHRQK